MKKLTSITVIVGLVLMVFTTFQGCAGAPTKLEQSVFEIHTNYVPKLVVVTNLVNVTNTVVQTEYVTNEVGVVVTQYSTNLIMVPEVRTALVTNYLPTYEYVKGTNAAEIQATLGAVGTLLGNGPLAAIVGSMFLGLWGWVRSTNKSKLAINSAQAIETMREFIKTLPNGQAYDTVITQWLQSHQADAGVLSQVVAMIQKNVNNPEAQIAAQDIIDALNSLTKKT